MRADSAAKRTAVNGHGFTSVFATQLAEYVEFKRAMGFDGASRIWHLKKFDSYCAEHERTVFDQETVEAWVTAQLATSGRYRPLSARHWTR